MTFVDTNVFMYAVGGPHPLRDPARAFFQEALAAGTPLVTSAEVLQELLHAYLPVHRMETLDAALALVEGCVAEVWPLEPDDVQMARALAARHPGLGARDLIHAASCRRRGVVSVKSYDRGLAAVFGE